MRRLPIAGLTLAAVLSVAAPAVSRPDRQDLDQLFVTGALSGVLGPEQPTPRAVRKMQHNLAATLTAYAEAQLGRPLTATDRERHDTAAITALWLTPGPSPVGWRNFRTRLHGEITPEVGLYSVSAGVCRNYSEYLWISPQADLRFQAVVCYDRDTGVWSVWPRTPDRP